jgi:RIO kinase 2
MAEGASEGENFKLDVVVEASGFGRKDMRILDEVSIIFFWYECDVHGIQYMEEVRNEEEILDEEEEEEDDDSSEYEEEASQDISTVTPREEDEEEEQGARFVEEKVHPLSRTPSPSLTRTALHSDGIKDIVSSDLTKDRARQQRKYHSKRSARQAGRPRGSKAKLDTRVKLESGGMWD